MERLNLVHVLEKTSLGTGSVVQMVEAARGQARAGHRVTVITRPDQALARVCRDGGCRHVALAMWHRFDVLSARRLHQLLRRVQPDCVHVHKGVAHAMVMGACWLGGSWPLVVNRGVSFPIPVLARPKYRSRRVRRVVAVSEAVREVVLHSTGLEPERVVVVYGGTDPDRFNPRRVAPGRVRREFGIPAHVPLVGQVGLRDWKGWREAMAALPAVRAAHPGTRLLLVGAVTDGRRRQVLELAAEMGLSGAVTVTPLRRDMPDVLAACDCVVDPSWAGTGITGTLREAMCLGRPVVATTIAGNPELVQHGISGLLVAPREHQSLAAAVIRLLGDREFARTLGSQARIRVRRHFSTALRLRRLEALYREVISEERP